jgi:hypothetical protein
VIWVNREQKYFSKRGWTAELPNSPSGKSPDLSVAATPRSTSSNCHGAAHRDDERAAKAWADNGGPHRRKRAEAYRII